MVVVPLASTCIATQLRRPGRGRESPVQRLQHILRLVTVSTMVRMAPTISATACLLQSLRSHLQHDQHAAHLVRQDLKEVAATSVAGRYSLSMAKPGMEGIASGSAVAAPGVPGRSPVATVPAPQRAEEAPHQQHVMMQSESTTAIWLMLTANPNGKS